MVDFYLQRNKNVGRYAFILFHSCSIREARIWHCPASEDYSDTLRYAPANLFVQGMKASHLGLIAWITGGLFTLLFVYVPSGKEWSAFDRIIQVISAIGTAGAVVIAIWLANAQTRERSRQRIDEAHLAAAGIARPICALHERLNHLIVSHDFSPLGAGGQPLPEKNSFYTRWLEDVKQCITPCPVQLSTDLLLKLVPLQNHCATRLHAAWVELQRISNSIELPGDSWEDRLDFSLQAKLKTYEIVAELAWCVDMLQPATQELKSAYNAATPYPSSEELYG